MRIRELERFIEKYPEIQSISFTCKKFPEWLDTVLGDTSTCRSTYISKTSVFFHLKEKK